MKYFEYMREIKEAFSSRDDGRLREIANDAIKEAVLTNSKTLSSIAVFAYSLSKILSKLHFKRRADWHVFEKKMSKELSEFIGLAKEKRELRGFVEARLIRLVAEIDEEYGNYVRNVVFKARVKMASTAYALGVSLGTAAELTGADKYELTKYVGVTRIHDRPFTKTLSVKDRYERVKKILRIKG